jgi:hypothetical protein
MVASTRIGVRGARCIVRVKRSVTLARATLGNATMSAARTETTEALTGRL